MSSVRKLVKNSAWWHGGEDKFTLAIKLLKQDNWIAPDIDNVLYF